MSGPVVEHGDHSQHAAWRGVLMLGLGRMGGPIARRLTATGVALSVYDIDAAAVQACVAHGATVADEERVACLDFDYVLVCLPAPYAVESWVERWRTSRRATRTVIADFTTAAPADAVRHAATLAPANIGYLDCPISGGEAGARSGELVMTAGGEVADYQRIEPLLLRVGNFVRHVGPAGAGSLLKAVNQSVYLAYNYVFAKGVELAVRRGLPRDIAMQALGRGAAGHPLINDRLMPAAGQGGSGIFSLERALKDLNFLELAPDDSGGAAEIHAILLREFSAAVEAGQGQQDIFTLAKC